MKQKFRKRLDRIRRQEQDQGMKRNADILLGPSDLYINGKLFGRVKFAALKKETS